MGEWNNMINKQPDGKDTRYYRYQATVPGLRPMARRSSLQQRNSRVGSQEPRLRKAQVVAPSLAERRVTVPHEAVQPLSWAERRERFRSPAADQPARGRLVQRTLAQTGRPAPIGRMRLSKAPSYRRARTAVPARSSRGKRGWRLWRRVAGFFAVLVVLSIGIGFALVSPTFHVQQVNIEGTQNARLIDAIRHMGIQGQDIFLLDSARVVARLETMPAVTSANLMIQLPGSVTVAIQERVPVLLWQTGHITFGIGQDGVVIAPQSELHGTGNLAFIIDRRQHTGMHAGMRLNTADVAFVEAIFAQASTLRGMASFHLQYVDTVTEGTQSVAANQEGRGSYVIESADGWQAYLGDEQNSNSLTDRLIELQQILDIAQRQHLRLDTIDLRFGSRAVYTIKS